MKITEIEKDKSPNKLMQRPLTYKRDALSPSVSKDTMDYHYGKLYKAYVDHYNDKEGDADFNEAGAFLHNIYFGQFKSYSGSNNPTGAVADLIEKNYKSWDKFKEEFEKEALSIQGSGWIYLARDGGIKTIKNHQIKKDILVLVDWWEHSWAQEKEIKSA